MAKGKALTGSAVKGLNTRTSHITIKDMSSDQNQWTLQI